MLAANMIAIVAGLIFQTSATIVAEGSVLHGSVNKIAAAVLFAQETPTCGITTTSSGTTRHTVSSYVPLTIDGPVQEMTSTNNALAISKRLSSEQPSCNTMPVDAIGFSGSGPLALGLVPETDHAVFGNRQGEEVVALNLDRKYPALFLTIDGPPGFDESVVNEATDVLFGHLDSNALSILDGPRPATPRTGTKHTAFHEFHPQTQNVPSTIDGLVLNNQHVITKAFFNPPMQSMRVTDAITASVLDAKDIEKKAAHLLLDTTVLLTCNGSVAEETFAKMLNSTKASPPKSADTRILDIPGVKGTVVLGENTSSIRYGPNHTIPLLFSPVYQSNGSVLSGFDYTEPPHNKSTPQTIKSGVIPLSRSPDLVPGILTRRCILLWYYGIGFLLYFLAHIFPHSIFGRYKDRCYNLVDVGTSWYLSLSQWQLWGGDGDSVTISKDEAIRVSGLETQIAQLQVDHQADQKSKDILIEEQRASIERPKTKTDTLENEKKLSEGRHSQQMKEKEKALESSQEGKSKLTETHIRLRKEIDQKTHFEEKLQKALEESQNESHRISIAYRQLCESKDITVAAGAQKDRKIDDLERQLQKNQEHAQKEQHRLSIAYRQLSESTDRKVAAGAAKGRKTSILETQLQSAEEALEKKSAEKVESDARMEGKMAEIAVQLDDTKAALEKKNAEVDALKEGQVPEISSLISEASTEVSENLSQISETSNDISGTQSLPNDTVNNAKTEEDISTSWADDCDDVTSSNDTTLIDSIDESQASSEIFDIDSGNLSQCKIVSSDFIEFARSAVDIFEDSMTSGCKATVSVGSRGVVAGIEKAKEALRDDECQIPEAKKGVAKIGRGLLRKEATKSKRLFIFGPN